MKRIIISFVILFLSINLNAQGLLGFGVQKLSKKKIDKIEIVLDQTEKISPSSVLDIEMIAFDKKLKEFKTIGLPKGDYSLKLNYKIEVENGYYDSESQKIIIKYVNELTSKEVKIKVSLLDTELSAEKVLKVNYLGLAVAGFNEANGRNGTSGSTKYLSFDGSNGQNGGSNSENGSNGKDITAVAKMVKVGSDEFLRVIVNHNNNSYYYSVNKLEGKILIDVSGGKGGNGGNAADGTSGETSKFINGGKGGNGSNGGDGGSVFIKLDENMKGYENLISFSTSGGGYGYEGRAGIGGAGYQKGSDGRKGLNGLQGRNGQVPKIVYETVDFKWYD